jgi:hypothetical protein
MSESTKLKNFEEFRAAEGEPFAEAIRQQREFLRDAAAADELLRPNAIALPGWSQWPPDNALATS